MKTFLVLAALALSTICRAADRPRQAPPVMTEEEIKAYIDAAVDKAVKERMPLAFSPNPKAPATPWNPVVRPFPPVGSSAPMTVMACPAGTACPAGCVDNGDGTCSCPQGTDCGMSQYGAYPTQGVYGTTYADDGGGDDSGARAKRARFHLFGKPHRR